LKGPESLNFNDSGPFDLAPGIASDQLLAVRRSDRDGTLGVAGSRGAGHGWHRRPARSDTL